MKHFIKWVVIFVYTIGIQNPAYSQTNGNQKKRPNIILIMADDLGYETLGCYGGTSYQTPQLDRMAAEGAKFNYAYSMPLCTPSRVEIMTGKYNFRNYEHFGYLNPKERTFANLLREEGYATAVAGKWQLDGGIDAPDNFGFDEYCLWQIQPGDFWYRYKNPLIYENGKQLKNTQGKYGPDIFVDFIFSFIEKKAKDSDPFFLYYPMCLVHDPFQPTPNMPSFKSYEIEGLNDTAYFDDMMHYMDAIMGKLMNKLQQMEIEDNTLVLFTGDNGTDRDVVSEFRGRTVRGDKAYTTEAGTHVPFIVWGPNQVPAGTISNRLVKFTDFLPSLMEMAGGVVPEDFITDGLSFYSEMIGKPEATRPWIFTDYDPNFKDFPARRYVQNLSWKLYTHHGFYNLQIDPKEIHPLDVDKLKGEALINYLELKQALSQFESINK